MKTGETIKHRGKTIRARRDSSNVRYYTIEEFVPLGKRFRKRGAARAAVDNFLELRRAARCERGPKEVGAEISYRDRVVQRAPDSKNGFKRYSIVNAAGRFKSIDAAIAEVDRIQDASEAIGTQRDWDSHPFKANLEK